MIGDRHVDRADGLRNWPLDVLPCRKPRRRLTRHVTPGVEVERAVAHADGNAALVFGGPVLWWSVRERRKVVPRAVAGASPHLAVGGYVANGEVRIPVGLVSEHDLVHAARLNPFHGHATALSLYVEERAIVVHHRVVEWTRIRVVGPPTVEHGPDRHVVGHIGEPAQLVLAARFSRCRRLETPHVIAMKMRDEAVVDRRVGLMRQHASRVPRDPFAYRT